MGHTGLFLSHLPQKKFKNEPDFLGFILFYFASSSLSVGGWGRNSPGNTP
jgi:hypothetical protein